MPDERIVVIICYTEYNIFVFHCTQKIFDYFNWKFETEFLQKKKNQRSNIKFDFKHFNLTVVFP